MQHIFNFCMELSILRIYTVFTCCTEMLQFYISKEYISFSKNIKINALRISWYRDYHGKYNFLLRSSWHETEKKYVFF